MHIEKRKFGKTKNNEDVYSFILKNDNGLEAEVLNYGGILRRFLKNGKDIILGYDDIKSYEEGDAYIGALIGRVGNRIGEGKFSLNGEDYSLAINNGPNTNHGGLIGFDSKVWDVKIEGDKLVLNLVSPDGDEGFPGELKVEAVYELDNDKLIISFRAKTDKATPINLTSHNYFNLAGSGTIKDQDLTIFSDKITETDENLLPTGEILNIKETPLDFTKTKKIDEAIKENDFKPIEYGKGLDHNFIFKDDYDTDLIKMASLENEDLKLNIISDQPGMQAYSGFFLNGKGKDGKDMNAYSGIAFEPQNWPDSINKENFPSMVLEPGETYKRKIIYEVESKN